MAARHFVLVATLALAATFTTAPAWSQDAAAEWEQHIFAGATAWGLARMDEAAKELDAALAIAEKSFAADDNKMIATLQNIVPLRRQQGKLPEAAERCEKLIALITKRDGDAESPELMAPLILQAAIYREMMNWDAADKAYVRNTALHIKYYGDAHPRTATIMEDHAVVLGRAGRTAEGLAIFAEVVDLWVYGLGPNHLREAISRRGYAEALRNAGKLDEAAAQEKQANEINAIWNAR